jgi:hypothetical protein
VAWTPQRSWVLSIGDVIHLPRGVPHAWRAIGTEPIRLTVTVTHSEFEGFFPEIESRGLRIANTVDLTDIAAKAGIEILGPPLSDGDVAAIMNGNAA